MSTRPLWAEISQQRLLANFRLLREAASPDADLLPVVKANAYGHDLRLCAPLLVEAGAAWLGVTGTDEGLALRAVCPKQRILLMSGIWHREADSVIEHNLTPLIWESYQLKSLDEAARRHGLPPAGFPIHLEIDTGMSRQGVRLTAGPEGHARPQGLEELAALLQQIDGDSRLRIEGVMTHFSAPGTLSSESGNPQLAAFAAAIDLILQSGHQPKWLHAGNSATVIAGPDRQRLIAIATKANARLMMRPGLSLYGYLDRFTCDGRPFVPDVQGFAPVLSWKTRVTSLRTICPGESVGYDSTFVARRETRLALLPAGYADGINRLLSSRGHVLIRSERAPIAGRVSMDQTVVDVTDIPGVSIGDEVVLIGDQGAKAISAWDIADLTGSIAWEVLCAISARVPRIAVK